METLFGDDPTVADIVWTGPQPLLRDKAASVGVSRALPMASLKEIVGEALGKGRIVHYLPPYRAENVLKIERLLGIHPSYAKAYASVEFTRAVVAQRSIKAAEEIADIEEAIDITCEMQTYAMKAARAGMVEREIAGAMHGIALARGAEPRLPDHFFDSRRDAAQPLSRQRDAERQYRRERLRSGVRPPLCRRSDAHVSRQRQVHRTAEGPVPHCPRCAAAGARRHQARCRAPRDPPVGGPDPGLTD